MASENPAYVQGNYNAGSAAFSGSHSYAAIIADAVTLLSNAWNDDTTFGEAHHPHHRLATETWYRTAIIAGKNLNFPQVSGTAVEFGTDGGTHNFLRLVEGWSAINLHYLGSMGVLHHSRQAVGTFKCCTIVYSAPTRDYKFDTEFLFPSKLPPGVPRLRDIKHLSLRREIQTAQ